MKIKDAIRLIETDGWYLIRQKGSHRHFQHTIKKGIVTIAGKESMDIHPKTMNSILKQAQLRENDK